MVEGAGLGERGRKVTDAEWRGKLRQVGDLIGAAQAIIDELRTDSRDPQAAAESPGYPQAGGKPAPIAPSLPDA